MRSSLGLFALSLAVSAHASELPTVASINLCADQLVLAIAEPTQILSVSWLAADDEESMLAERAKQHALNYGSAETLLSVDPDVVVGGTYTNLFSRQLLAELGYEVVEVAPAESLDDIARNIRQVAAAIDRAEQGENLVTSMRDSARRIDASKPARPVSAIVVRPGGFTVGTNSLADELIRLAGLVNLAAGLDRWGSLSMESLLESRPDLLVYTGYREAESSLANEVFNHPALVKFNRRNALVDAKYWACGLPQSLRSAEILQQAATNIAQ